MKEPNDATLDVKQAFREVMQEINDLKKLWVDLNGTRLIGAGDAVTPTGLVTLRQLNAIQSDAKKEVDEVLDKIDKLKLDNNLV